MSSSSTPGSATTPKSEGGGFSSIVSRTKFTERFKHVVLQYPTCDTMLQPHFTLDEDALKLFLTRFIPSAVKFESVMLTENEKSLYFFIYGLLSFVALYQQKKVVLDVSSEISENVDPTAFLYHEFELGDRNSAAKGPIEFVTRYGRESAATTSVFEVKKEPISENVFRNSTQNTLFQFLAQLSVAVEMNRSVNCTVPVFGGYTDGYCWIFAKAVPCGEDVNDKIIITLSKPLHFQADHKFTPDTLKVVEFLFSSLYPQVGNGIAVITKQAMDDSFGSFDKKVAQRSNVLFSGYNSADLRALAAEEETAVAVRRALAAEQEKAVVEQRALAAEQEKAVVEQEKAVVEQEKAVVEQRALAAKAEHENHIADLELELKNLKHMKRTL